MKLKHDSQGFLVGESVDNDRAAEMLRAIKGDTGRMLAAMLEGGRIAAGDRRRAVVAQVKTVNNAQSLARAGGQGRAALPLVSEQSRRASMAPRDALGRFVAVAGAKVATPAARKTAVAKAVQAVAADQAPQRAARTAAERVVSAVTAVARPDTPAANALRAQRAARESVVADAAAAASVAIERERGADGRFKAKTPEELAALAAAKKAAKSGGGFGFGRGGAVGGEGAAQLDPALAAAAEVKAIASTLNPMRLVSMFRRDGDGDEKEQKAQTGLLKKILGAMRERAGGMAASLPGIPGLGGLKLPGGAAGAGGAAAGLAAAAKSLIKRIPYIGGAFEAISGALDEAKIKADETLSQEQKDDAILANRAKTGGAVLGTVGGGVLGSMAGAVGTAAGAALGGYVGGKLGDAAGDALNSKAGKQVRKSIGDLYDKGLGAVAALMESGGRKGSAGTVSTGKGDHGGVSYGTHQLASKTGTLQKFLSTSGYGEQFAGMAPGSAEFNAKWKQVAAADPNFGKAQHDFMVDTHYGVAMNNLAKSGLDLSGRGKAVQEAVFSTATQYGPHSGLIRKALAGQNLSALSDADIINKIQDYKAANLGANFRSSSQKVRDGIADRIGRERGILLGMASQPAQPMGQPDRRSVV